ncbi:MAG: GNAT family N-acetyltransferase [Deltaproteobacteria bacterium]|nr:GNAT family N-acetyltransferase [Deltaproteobacteria bacterium]
MILDEYPKSITLKDGSSVTLRPMVKQDEKALLDFFGGLSKADMLYLRDDVANADVIKNWANSIDYDRVLPILAFSGDRIVGNATLHQNPFSWMRHVGQIRMVIASDHREKGLARAMAAEVFQNALAAKLEKLVAEMLTDQHDARKVFSRLGFREEAILKDHVLDARNVKHDLLIMTNDVNILWQKYMEFSESISGSWDMEY